MPSQRISYAHGLLLLLAALTRAQETTPTPSPPSAGSPPFPLDSNGEAHFNIPVVVKLADLTNGAPAAGAGAPSSGAAAAAVAARDVDALEPVFEVAHQGSATEGEELKARNDMAAAGNAAGAGAAMGTHTVLLVETTGTATRTLTESCTDPAAAGHGASASPSGASASSNNSDPNTTATPPAPVAADAVTDANKVPPVPSNHTGFPLRNGTEGSLPCNSTGLLPHSTGARVAQASGAAKPSGTGAEHQNPANAAAGNGTKPFMGAAARFGGGSWSISVGGVVLLVVAGSVAVAAF